MSNPGYAPRPEAGADAGGRRFHAYVRFAQLRGVTCGNAEHMIISGEKDVDCRLLGTREMQGIVGAKP